MLKVTEVFSLVGLGHFHPQPPSHKINHYIIIISACTFGGCISGDRDPPQYCNTGELEALILSACFTALWSIHTITFLLVSPLHETVTGEPSESTATAHKTICAN